MADKDLLLMTDRWLQENDPEWGGGEYPYLTPSKLKQIKSKEIQVKGGIVEYEKDI